MAEASGWVDTSLQTSICSLVASSWMRLGRLRTTIGARGFSLRGKPGKKICLQVGCMCVCVCARACVSQCCGCE